MSVLLDLFNDMSAEQQAGLGKVSSKIGTPGVHLVTIESMKVIDKSRVRIDFKDASGQMIDYTGFLTNKDATKIEATVQRVMGQVAQICIAAGTNLKTVLSKSVAGTETFKTGEVATDEYTLLKGKKLYIVTTTVVEGDAKDDKKVWVKQEVDTFKFFDVKKRNGLEIAANAEEGVTMEDADTEAKNTFEAHYKFANNKAVQAKVQELRRGGRPSGNSASVNPDAEATVVADDDI